MDELDTVIRQVFRLLNEMMSVFIWGLEENNYSGFSLAEIDLKDLGVTGRSFDVLMEQVKRPNGMVVTTGPTGSGKTTTLYAMLQELNKPGVKIITLEDPVEYRMPGINQSQIDPSRDYTFASGLRALMRQDPDIAMVGEMRDLETVDVAIQAALTGHLIISTIHSNSASGAIPRFLSMGAKPFLLAPALRAVMGQRLLRRLCDKCKIKAEITPSILARIAEAFEKMAPGVKQPDSNTEFFAPKGCEECSNLGYFGRIGIFEIFKLDDQIEALILKGNCSEAEVKIVAIGQGMVTLVQDGIFKAATGVTSLDEVFRVAE